MSLENNCPEIYKCTYLPKKVGKDFGYRDFLNYQDGVCESCFHKACDKYRGID